MIIKSNFRDYYDNIKSFGVDTSIIYKRQTIEYCYPIETATKELVKLNNILEELVRLPVYFACADSYLVLFCNTPYQYAIDFDNKIITNLDQLIKIEYQYEKRFCKPKDKYLKEKLKKIKDTVHKQSTTSYLKYHLYFNSPVIFIDRWHRGRVIINPNLKKIGFNKLVNPFDAFQRISQFITNEMVIQKEPNPAISDKLKAETHGFDKWSFRRHKEDNKLRKRK